MLRFLRYDLRKVDCSLFDAVSRFVQPGAVVWDIGANIGLFSLAAAVRAGKQGAVFAFEPDVWLANLLNRSRLLQGIDALAPISVLPIAICNRTGFSEFIIANRGRSNNSLPGFGDDAQSGGVRYKSVVPTYRADDLLSFSRPPDVLKIDVEGAEIEVLLSAANVLKFKPTILCEVFAEHREAVSDLLHRAGYVLFDQNNASNTPVDTAAWNTIALHSSRI
jgi:FkbM family methyltransferase